MNPRKKDLSFSFTHKHLILRSMVSLESHELPQPSMTSLQPLQAARLWPFHRPVLTKKPPALVNEIKSLSKEVSHGLLPCPSVFCPVKMQQKHLTKQNASPWSWISSLQNREQWISVLYKLHTLWCSVIAAQTKTEVQYMKCWKKNVTKLELYFSLELSFKK